MPTVEGDYDRVGQDISRDARDVENAPGNAERDVKQGVEDVPSDVSGGVRDAASWVGDKLGGAENEGRRAENDVNQFDQNVDNSYDQGEQQGKQSGW